MSSLAYLVGDDHSAPHTAESEFDYDSQVLCTSNWLIPVFWLFCFDESNIRTFEWDGHIFPTLVARHEAVEKLLIQRTPIARMLLPEHIDRWEEWLQLIAESPFPYLKLNAFEVWCMGPEDPVNMLTSALRWFRSGSRSDLVALFWLASINYDNANARIKYDVAKRDFTWKPHESPGLYLQGGMWQREVPWDEG